jgi:hypothetical protein
MFIRDARASYVFFQRAKPIRIVAALWALLVMSVPAAAACDPSSFTNRVKVLVPSGSSAEQPTTQMIQDLGDAYCNASPVFRYQLDTVDFIFIDATICANGNFAQCGNQNGARANSVAWGMRAKGGYTQIGIPASLWPPQQNAVAYVNYEADVLNNLMGWVSSSATFATSSSNPTSTPWMTVLAALAHELGHVRWFEVNARAGWGNKYDFTRLNNSACAFFAGWQNNQNMYLSRKDRWRHFGDNSNEKQNDHAAAPMLIGQGSFSQANTDQLKGPLLNSLFASGQPWVSYLGANAPDEDFVETYKFAVLIAANPGLTTMQVTIPFGNGTSSTQQDVPSDYVNQQKVSLAAKINCLKTAGVYE